MNVEVGISEMKITSNPEDTLIVRSLGSCIGMSIYDPIIGTVALVHCLLPLSKIDPEKATSRPYTFVDTGVAAVLTAFIDAGSRLTDLVSCVAGGANMISSMSMDIGHRNCTVARKILWKNNILIHGEDLGGESARTMIINARTGITTLQSGGKVWEMAHKNKELIR